MGGPSLNGAEFPFSILTAGTCRSATPEPLGEVGGGWGFRPHLAKIQTTPKGNLSFGCCITFVSSFSLKKTKQKKLSPW